MVFVAWSGYYVKKQSAGTPLKFMPDFIQLGSTGFRLALAESIVKDY